MAPSARASPARPRSGDPTGDVDSPVFRFHHADSDGYARRSVHVHGDGNYAVVTQQNGPWTADEHQRFLNALEKHGCGTSTSVFAAWHAIAAAVATRSVADVKSHASHYYAKLQAANLQRRKEFLAMQQIDARWTRHEDTQLEDELASHIPVRVAYPWETIARRVPGKTPREVRERYHKLCYDISRIEAGQHVSMQLSRQSRLDGDNHRPHERDRDDPSENHTAIDCVVTLTPSETQTLMRALELVPVPSHASPDVLVAVASGVAVLAGSTHKQPPRRSTALFSVDEACAALTHAIDAALREPLAVLELLADELRLWPPPEPVPFTQMRHNSPRQFYDEASEPSPLPSMQFQSASCTLDDRMVHDDTRAGEELLAHLKTSPVHDPRRSRGARRRTRGGVAVAPPPYDFDVVDGAVDFPFPAHSQSTFPYSLMPPTAAARSGYCDRRGYDASNFPSNQDDPMDDYFY